MNIRFVHYLQLAIAVLDLLIFNVVLYTAGYLFQHSIAMDHNRYVALCMWFNLAWLISVVVSNAYHKRDILIFESSLLQAVKTYANFLLITSLLLLFQHYLLSKPFLLVVLLSLPLPLLTNRILFVAVYQYYKRKDFLLDKVMIIGYNNTSKQLIENLEENSLNKEIVGICEEAGKIDEVTNYPVLSDLTGILDVCKKYGVNEIYSSIAPEHNPEIYKLILQADQHCIRFRLVPDVSFFVKKEVHLNYMSGMPVLSFRKEPLEEMTNRIVKRAFDIIVSLLVIVFVLSWLAPLLGLLIGLESAGPIFFKQLRAGKSNHPFLCLKFRSMAVNKDADARQAVKNDSRLTRVGKFIRRTNLDEMPQFINVLLGQMSVIGPRPHPMSFFSMLRSKDDVHHLQDDYMIRHFVKPGVSGWAQVNGYRGEIENSKQLDERIKHDIWYSENWSLLLDIRIVLLTVFNTLKGEKNAF